MESRCILFQRGIREVFMSLSFVSQRHLRRHILLVLLFLTSFRIWGTELGDRLENLHDRVSDAYFSNDFDRAIALTETDFFENLRYEDLEIPEYLDLSSEQLWYLSIRVRRGQAYFDLEEFENATMDYEFYFQNMYFSSYLSPLYLHFTNAARAYAEVGRSDEDIDDLLLYGIRILSPEEKFWIYSVKQEIIDAFGKPEDAVTWAEKASIQDPWAVGAFDRASLAEFEAGNDEAGVSWFFRALSIQYNQHGIQSVPLLLSPEVALTRRWMAGKDTSALDLCTWYMGALYGWTVEDSEYKSLRQNVQNSIWGEFLPDSPTVDLYSIYELRYRLDGQPDLRMVAPALAVATHFDLMNEDEESLKYVRFVRELIESNSSVERNWGIYIETREAAVLRATGDIMGALDILERLEREIRETSGTQSLDYARVIGTIGKCQNSLGRYDEAAYNFLQAADAAKAAGDYEFRDVWHIWMANTYRAAGEYALAIPILDELVEMAEWTIPEDPADVVGTYLWSYIDRLQLRARNNIAMGNMELASADFDSFGKLGGHIEFLSDKLSEGDTELYRDFLLHIPTLQYLSFDLLDYLILDDDPQAESVMVSVRENMALYEQMESYVIPESIQRDFLLLESRWYEYMGDIPEALNSLDAASENYIQLVETQWDFLNERERTSFLGKIDDVVDRYHDMASEYGETYPETILRAYEMAMSSKAILLRSGTDMRRFLQQEDLPVTVLASRDNWATAKSELAKYYCGFTDSIDQSRLEMLEQRADALERELSGYYGSGTSRAFGSFKVTDVSTSLSPEEAAVEIVHSEGNGYAAYVTEFSGTVRVVSLCSEEDTDGILEKWRGFIQSGKNRTDIDRLAGDRESDRVAGELFDVLWAPLESELTGFTRIYLSPDGIYQLVNPATLVDSNDRYLGEYLQIVMMTTTSDLASDDPVSQSDSSGRTALLLGAPSYNMDTTGIIEVDTDSDSDRSVDFFNRLDRRFTEVPSLPGTRREVEAVAQLLEASNTQVEMLTESAADEYNLKRIDSPDILHLATHGFFLDDEESRGKNPMLRSGLLLAGCENGYRQSGEAFEDGILTAYEAQDLNLSDTDLVILSACETAIGEVMSGEGVFGLQRSFLMAGAGHLIISLWSVDDKATADFMIEFYSAWLESDNIATGFATAVDRVREKYIEPYYWGSFILVERQTGMVH